MNKRTMPLLVTLIFFLTLSPAIATTLEYIYIAGFDPSAIGLGPASEATATMVVTMTDAASETVPVSGAGYFTEYKTYVPTTEVTLAGTTLYDGTYPAMGVALVRQFNTAPANAPDEDWLGVLLRASIGTAGTFDFVGGAGFANDFFPDTYPDPIPLTTFSDSDILGLVGYINSVDTSDTTVWSTEASLSAVPEPTTSLLLLTGTITMAAAGLRKKLSINGNSNTASSGNNCITAK